MPGIITTVAFKSENKEAFDAFWTDIRERYRFCDGDATVPTQAFAVSMGDLFAESEVITEILNSNLDAYEKCEAIAEVGGTDDPNEVLTNWEITPFPPVSQPLGE